MSSPHTSASASDFKAVHPVYGAAAVSSSQPLASAVGLQVLSAGGTAADAAIAMGAMLAVTEPTSNGLGGDLVALYRPTCISPSTTTSASTVKAILGIGASPQALTAKDFIQPGGLPPRETSGLTVTVPGVVAAWYDLKRMFGSSDISMAVLLDPAIRAAEDGFFVHPVTAALWQCTDETILTDTPFEQVPNPGDRVTNRDLAITLRAIRDGGADAFYKADSTGSGIASAIVDALKDAGAPFMTKDDLARHRTEIVDALGVEYRDRWTVYEPGAPTHGAVALLALRVIRVALERLGLDGRWDGDKKKEIDRTHVMIEALRLSFREGCRRIGDGKKGDEGVVDMVRDDGLMRSLAEQISLGGKCVVSYEDDDTNDSGKTWRGGTVQFCVVDRDGNAVSVTQSNYQGFGTGIIPRGCGFSLQNRGLNFAVQGEKHVNFVCGGKRPYHTIMPGLMARKDKDEENYEDDEGQCVAFGVMGSFMQPQGHVRVVTGLVDKGLDAKQCLDQWRFRVTGPFSRVEGPDMERDGVLVEADADDQVVDGLRLRGHEVKRAAAEAGEMQVFGRGHVCARRKNAEGEGGRVQAGADCRGDGMAMVWM